MNMYKVQERFEDTKGVIRSRKSKKDIPLSKKRTKGQTTIYKALHSTQHEPNQ